MLRNVSASDAAPAQEGILCCQVVNFKQYGSKEALEKAFGERWTYIGRANRAAGLAQSPLANPFRVSDFGGQRGATLPRYRHWLWRRIYVGDTAVIEALRAIDDSTALVCWCVPGPCHGHIVKAAAKWLRAQSGHTSKPAPCPAAVSGTDTAPGRSKQQVAFVSGHRDLTPAEFYQHYQPALDRAIAAGHQFVVGDAPGADAMTQMYLAGRISPEQVTVFHSGTRPRHRLSSFTVKGGYNRQPAKDAAMTAVSDYDIAWVRPGKQASGTARNLARRQHTA